MADGAPSPVLPALLIVILWVMMMIPAYMRYDYHVTKALVMVQQNLALGSFLIPVVLSLAVQAFGLPQPAPQQRAYLPPIVHAATQTSSVSLIALISFLLFVISLYSSSAPIFNFARQNRAYYTGYPYPVYRKAGWFSMY